MHRFYLPPAQSRDDTLFLTGGEAHHAMHVLRLRQGERVVVLDGAGQELLCEALKPGPHSVQLAVVQRNRVHPLPCQITLLQAVPKGKIIEGIIQKATELGAHRIVPLLSDRVTARLDEESAADKAEKWRTVAIEAIKQCGSAWLPQVASACRPCLACVTTRPHWLTLTTVEGTRTRWCGWASNPVWGRQPLPGRFDSCCLPPVLRG